MLKLSGALPNPYTLGFNLNLTLILPLRLRPRGV